MSNDLTILRAKYVNAEHTIINMTLQRGEDQIPYTFIPGEDSTDDLYNTINNMYNAGEFVPEQDRNFDLLVMSADIRLERDSILCATDKYMIEDYPISKEDKDELKAYRQALRNITDQKAFPENVVWPERPKFLDS